RGPVRDLPGRAPEEPGYVALEVVRRIPSVRPGGPSHPLAAHLHAVPCRSHPGAGVIARSWPSMAVRGRAGAPDSPGPGVRRDRGAAPGRSGRSRAWLRAGVARGRGLARPHDTRAVAGTRASRAEGARPPRKHEGDEGCGREIQPPPEEA